jgi:hypothetical protein
MPWMHSRRLADGLLQTPLHLVPEGHAFSATEAEALNAALLDVLQDALSRLFEAWCLSAISKHVRIFELFRTTLA